MRRSILPALLAAPLLGSCLAVGTGVVGGYVVYNTISGGVRAAQVRIDVDYVWPTVQEVVSEVAETTPTVSEDPRVIQTTIHGSEVEVEVQAYDIDESIIKVDARKRNFPQNKLAQDLMNDILDRLEPHARY